MNRLLGHTLGTPDLPLLDALELFADAGLDGAEVIWLDDYASAIPESDDGTAAGAAKAAADRLGISIGGLTPYVSDINSLDEEVRRREMDRLRAAIRTASDLECGRIRVYGGTLMGGETPDIVAARWERLVASLVELGPYALTHGVVLCVENHFATMTESAEETVRLMQEVDSPGVGILYDQANLAFTHREEYEEAVAIQAPWIRHVHVKDLEFIDPDRRLTPAAVSHIDKATRIHMSRMIGDGILDWTSIIRAVEATGYDGAYSLEYEYRWNPEDLPEPQDGFPESNRRFRSYFEEATGHRTDAPSATA
ncbi:MAG: sugar phosphate isomerase/epimerase [Actinobacteria bacterium]|nr:sugar phosphate isomerase/epimerase [Actinomycetota bacterium]